MTAARWRERAHWIAKCDADVAGNGYRECRGQTLCALHEAIARLAAEAFDEGVERAAKMCADADKNTHPSTLAAAIRALKVAT